MYHNRLTIKTIILSILILVPLKNTGQNLHTHSNKALKNYNAGKQAYDFLDLKSAESLLKEAISIDNDFYEAYMELGEMTFKLKRFAESAGYYRKAVKIDSLFYKPVFYSLASAEMMSGDYENALRHFRIYLEQKTNSEKNRNNAQSNIANCEFALKALKNPVMYNPINIGDSINTKDDEYWPSITVDGKH
jgi:tetratricopeptide (TPR) repeat protein